MRPTVLILSYPVITHIGVITRQAWMVWAVFGAIVFWVLWTVHYKSPALKTIAISLGIAVFAILFAMASHRFTLFYFPPILISASLLMVFGKSLFGAATPLVTQIATLVHGSIDERMRHYTRKVTLVWTLFFAAMTLETILLALYGPIETWSLITNFVNYGLILLFFVIEYRIRIRLFTEMKHPGFINFMKILAKTDIKRL